MSRRRPSHRAGPAFRRRRRRCGTGRPPRRKGRAAVNDAGLADRITLHQGVMHEMPYPDAYFDFVWCRDVLEQVDDLAGALREVVRVMKPGRRLLVYTTVATDPPDGRGRGHDAATPRQRRWQPRPRGPRAHLRASRASRSSAVRVIGTEWREHAEERTQPVSRALLGSPDCAANATTSSPSTAKTSSSTSRPTSTGRSSSSSGSSNRSSTRWASRHRRSVTARTSTRST